MLVVKIVRAPPNGRRTEDPEPKEGHQGFGYAGTLEDRRMLLVVVNDEKAYAYEACEHTASYLEAQVNVPVCAA